MTGCFEGYKNGEDCFEGVGHGDPTENSRSYFLQAEREASRENGKRRGPPSGAGPVYAEKGCSELELGTAGGGSTGAGPTHKGAGSVPKLRHLKGFETQVRDPVHTGKDSSGWVGNGWRRARVEAGREVRILQEMGPQMPGCPEPLGDYEMAISVASALLLMGPGAQHQGAALA